MKKGSHGVFGVLGLLCFYGLYLSLSEGRVRLDRHGEPRFLSWNDDPVLFGGSTVLLAALGVFFPWYWWTRR